MDFNAHKHDYVTKIENSLQFTGKEHDFFTRVKAEVLKKIIKQHVKTATTRPHLLDVGCGHGLIHQHLKDAQLMISGVEVADEVLQLAKQTNPEVDYQPHDGKTLPFANHQFDIALAICVMHHVPPVEWEIFLQEMKRVVKPNGLVIIFEHNPFNPFTRYIVANNVLDDEAVLLSHFKLTALMRKVGLVNTTSRNILFTPFAHRLFRKLDGALGCIPLGAQYYALGRA